MEVLEAYDLRLKFYTERDSEAFSVDDHYQQAKEILRKLNLRVGQLSQPIIDNRAGDVTTELAEELIPEIADIQMADEAYRQQYGDYAERPYTPTEEAYKEAYKMLLDAKAHKPKTLGTLYQEYKSSTLKGKDPRDLKRIDTRWS